jgi:hypothetical protein
MNTHARKLVVFANVLPIAALLTLALKTPAGEIQDLYYQQPHTKLPTDLWHHETTTTNGASRQFFSSTIANPPSFKTHGISEIGIERTPCYGKCPTYTLIVKSDGTLRYKGVANVERLGEYTGKIDQFRFEQLAQFIKDSDYMELDDAYTHMITDNPSVYTTVLMSGKRKTIRNYANSGPTKLWAIEQLIDELMVKAQWSTAQKPP